MAGDEPRLEQRSLELTAYDDGPALLLFADCLAGFERGRRTAQLAGCRIAAEAAIAAAAERLALQAAPAAVLVEIADRADGLEPLLDALQIAAEQRAQRSIVSAPPALIDLVAARAPDQAVAHLCDASEAERVTALALATARPKARLHDVGRGEGAVLLQQLSEEVGRIATILASLSEEEAAGAAARTAEAEEEDGPTIDARFVRSMIRARRLRDQYFGGDLFADPAWDMLLDLMAARLERSQVAVSSLCIAAAVPPTTALRWIKALTDRGLFVRAADPADGRRVYIELSEEAARALTGYLRVIQRTSPHAV